MNITPVTIGLYSSGRHSFGACPDSLVEPGGDKEVLASKQRYAHYLGSRQSGSAGSESRTFSLARCHNLKDSAASPGLRLGFSFF